MNDKNHFNLITKEEQKPPGGGDSRGLILEPSTSHLAPSLLQGEAGLFPYDPLPSHAGICVGRAPGQCSDAKRGDPIGRKLQQLASLATKQRATINSERDEGPSCQIEASSARSPLVRHAPTPGADVPSECSG